MIRVERERAGERGEHDHTIGCGQPPEGYQDGQPFKSGPVCAGTGAQLSCQVCPHSPSYWRNEEPVAPVSAEHLQRVALVDWGTVLDWGSGGERGSAGDPRPCVRCGGPAITRNSRRQSEHKVCAEGRASPH